jgi:hypothetical protein
VAKRFRAQALSERSQVVGDKLPLHQVGGAKQFSSTLQDALVEERHFALVEAVAFALPTQARS